jgi:hypothetical protein
MDSRSLAHRLSCRGKLLSLLEQRRRISINGKFVMTKRGTSSIGIAGFLLLAVAGSANAEIIRCTDGTGSTTFTDTPCTSAVNGVQALPAEARPDAKKRFQTHGKFAAAEKARSIAALKRISSNKSDSLDETTVRGAKAYTDAMDIASDLARQQASAERALRVNRWAFWRL